MAFYTGVEKNTLTGIETRRAFHTSANDNFDSSNDNFSPEFRRRTIYILNTTKDAMTKLLAAITVGMFPVAALVLINPELFQEYVDSVRDSL
ncbi:MAG: hypothetical protein ACE5F4_01305 [Candidatus Paceibacteria bacterium]